MRLVVLDAETFFRRANTEADPSYTLSSMSTESYIRDPRFEAHGAAIKWSADTLARWYDERQLRFVLAQEDWSDTLLVCHHMQFDGLILSHHYNVHPARLGCTLSMARLMLGNHLSVSLEQVRKHFGMPGKFTPYNLFEGRHWNEITRDVQEQIAEGACDECESIWKIFHLLMQQGFPPEELKVVDTTMKMFTEPVLRGDFRPIGKNMGGREQSESRSAGHVKHHRVRVAVGGKICDAATRRGDRARDQAGQERGDLRFRQDRRLHAGVTGT